MSLPKRFRIIVHLLLFIFVVVGGSVYAQNMPKPATTSAQPNTQNNQNVVLPTNQGAQILPKPNNDNSANTNLPNGQTNVQVAECGIGAHIPGIGTVCNSIKSTIDALADCGGNVWCYMSGGVEVIQAKALDEVSGCGNATTPTGLQDCQKKYAVILNGGSLADVQNPGALFIAGNFADASLRMPVPINTNQYLATINPLQAGTVNAQAVNELDTSGLVKLWQNVRNAAFAFSALVLVVIGFMIMFRSRLDPRTSITVMNSLPKVIFSMVLIYFSFALSGFMLDMGRLVLQLVYRTVPFSGGTLASGLLELLVVILLGWISAFVVAGPAGVVVGIGLLLLALIVALFLLVVILNLIYQMLKRYMQFIVYTIFSPLFFLWGAMPGQSTFGWFKSQLANVMAIPAMLLIIRLAAYIGFNSFSIGRLGGSGINLPSPFSVGAGSTTGLTADIFWFLISPLVSLVLLFYATKMPSIIDGILQIKDYGSRAGIGPGVIFAPVGMAGNAGKTLTSLQGGMGTLSKIGTGIRNIGWGAIPKPTRPIRVVGNTNPPGGGNTAGYFQSQAPAPENPGKGASIARGIATASGNQPKSGYIPVNPPERAETIRGIAEKTPQSPPDKSTDSLMNKVKLPRTPKP